MSPYLTAIVATLLFILMLGGIFRSGHAIAVWGQYPANRRIRWARSYAIGSFTMVMIFINLNITLGLLINRLGPDWQNVRATYLIMGAVIGFHLAVFALGYRRSEKPRQPSPG